MFQNQEKLHLLQTNDNFYQMSITNVISDHVTLFPLAISIFYKVTFKFLYIYSIIHIQELKEAFLEIYKANTNNPQKNIT